MSAKRCPPSFVNLEHGFCDPRLARPSKCAVFRLRDGARVEIALRDAVSVHVCEGPRLELHQVIVARPSTRSRPSVAIVQLRDLSELDGMPEVLRALEHFEAGRLQDAARLASAAGRRWAGLVDYFGGPS